MTPHIKKKAGAATSFLIKTLVGLLFVSPLIIGVCFSLQTDKELMTYPLHLIPRSLTLEGYANVFAKVPLLQYLKNSAVVCVVCIVARWSTPAWRLTGSWILNSLARSCCSHWCWRRP